MNIHRVACKGLPIFFNKVQMSALKEQLTALAEPLLASLNLRLWGLEFIPASRSILRFYIENTDGTDTGIAECSRASRLIGMTLEVEDLIEDSYLLEVSTPGLERIFFTAEQLQKYAGEIIDLSLHTPEASHPGRKRFSGRLAVPGAEGAQFGLELLNPADLSPEDAPALNFNWDNVKRARLVYVVPEKKGAPKPKEPRPAKKPQKKENGNAN